MKTIKVYTRCDDPDIEMTVLDGVEGNCFCSREEYKEAYPKIPPKVYLVTVKVAEIKKQSVEVDNE